jgi:hypothetical protein
VAAVLRGGCQALEGERHLPQLTSPEPLTDAFGGSPRQTEIDVPPELLADLHEPRLIITPNYVGSDRRVSGARRPHRRGFGPSVRLIEVVVIIMATVVAVVPLTLLASHAAVAVSSPPQSSTPQSSSLRADRASSQPRSGRALRGRSARVGPRARPAHEKLAAAATATCAATGGAPLSQRCSRRQAASERHAQRALRHTARVRQRKLAKAAAIRSD